MQSLIHLTPRLAVTGALAPEDFSRLAQDGFKAVVSLLPDGESAGQMNAREEAVRAWREGLKFAHVPAPKLDLLTDPVVEGLGDALHRLDGPVLIHCQSGTRAAIVWAAASARTQSVDCVLDTLKAAGFDLEFLRDDLDAQADRARWLQKPATPLDCGCPEVRLPAAA